MTTGSARGRVQRTLFLAIGAASLVHTVLGIGKARGEFGLLPPGWGAAFYVACATLPVLAAIAALTLRTRVAVASLAAFCVVYALVLCSWVPLTVVTGELTSAPWPWDIGGLAPAAAALVFAPRVAWPYIVGVCAATAVVRGLTAPGAGWVIAAQDGMFLLVLGGLMAILIQIALTAGSALDRTDGRARQEAAREAATRTERLQRARIDALVHDHVLSVLLMAGRSDDGSRGQLRTHARQALAALDPQDRGESTTGEELLARIRGAIPDVFRWRGRADADARLPGEVSAAVVEAVAAAARNSVQHAGETARTIDAVVGDGEIVVAVRDEGCGFDPNAIRPGRLGVRVSIHERMSTIDGGSAEIDSRPGAGTTVTIRWQDSRRD